MGGKVVALRPFGDEGAQLDVFPGHLLGADAAGEDAAQLLLGERAVGTGDQRGLLGVEVLVEPLHHTVEGGFGRVGNVAEHGVVGVAVECADDRPDEVDAHLLAFAVDVAVGAAAEVDALEGAGGLSAGGEDLPEGEFAGAVHQQGFPRLDLADGLGREVEGGLEHGALRGHGEHFVVLIPEGGADAPGVAHGEEFARAGDSAEHVAAVPDAGALLEDAGHVDVALDIFGDVGVGQSEVEGLLEAALALAVEPVAELLEEDVGVGDHAGVLAFDGDRAEDLLHVGHVEIGADAEVFRPPVASAHEGVDKRNAASARCGIAEMTHINLSDKGAETA